MPTELPRPFARLPEVQSDIRRAVEERNYPRVLSLVDEQQAIFRMAGRHHPETSRFAQTAHELTVWALTMVRIQRAHTESAIRQLSAAKRIADHYRASIGSAIAFGDRRGNPPFVIQG
jgi:hypothetical protein